MRGRPWRAVWTIVDAGRNAWTNQNSGSIVKTEVRLAARRGGHNAPRERADPLAAAEVMLFWKVHRAWFRVTGGRRGLWPARAQRWGALRLTTIGRRGRTEARLWERWRSLDKNLDAEARLRSTPRAVVVLELS